MRHYDRETIERCMAGELGIFRPGIVMANVEPLKALTLCTRLGDYFAYACILLTAAGLPVIRNR